jgi:hypothetical protein
MKKFIQNGVFVFNKWNLAWTIEIAKECNVDCESHILPNVKEQIYNSLKGCKGQFVRLLYPPFILFLKDRSSSFANTIPGRVVKMDILR